MSTLQHFETQIGHWPSATDSYNIELYVPSSQSNSGLFDGLDDPRPEEEATGINLDFNITYSEDYLVQVTEEESETNSQSGEEKPPV